MSNRKKLIKEKRRIGTQGWQEFLESKQGLINEYEHAKAQDAHRPVTTERGNVAEAVYRKWLGEFLPARYGVTNGFVISAGYSDRVPLKHYDVIVYDRLEAPVLWHSNNDDKSETGKERAIPVEYVLHISEVKSMLTKESILEAREKLLELEPLLSGINQPVPMYFPVQFATSIVFFDIDEKLKREHLNPLIMHPEMKGRYLGGIILKSPDGDRNKSIRFTPKVSTTEAQNAPSEGGASSLYGALSTSPPRKVGNGYHWLMLDWGEIAFADYAHSIIRRMRQDYDTSSVASWHGLSYGPFDEDDDMSSTFPLDPK